MQHGSRSRALLYGAAILWTVLLAYFSLAHLIRHAYPGTIGHRIEHVAAFGVLAFLLLTVAVNRVQEWITVLALVCFAAALELGQHHLFRVPLEWFDIRDDVIGVLFAWLVVRSAQRGNLRKS